MQVQRMSDMTLDIYSREDIVNAILAANEASPLYSHSPGNHLGKVGNRDYYGGVEMNQGKLWKLIAVLGLAVTSLLLMFLQPCE